jgi:adenosylhomocysteine nucleosidase
LITPPSILVCFAVPQEAQFFRVNGEGSVATIITGMGKDNASIATRAQLVRRPATLVLTCGFAGGLDPDLPVGTVVFESDKEDALAFALANAGAQRGRFYSADRVAITREEKHALRVRTKADAVEMESGAIRDICKKAGIPSATIRVISDGAKEDLPLNFNAVLGPDHQISPGKLAWELIRRPGKIPALLALRKTTTTAARQLAAVLDAVLLGLLAGG